MSVQDKIHIPLQRSVGVVATRATFRLVGGASSLAILRSPPTPGAMLCLASQTSVGAEKDRRDADANAAVSDGAAQPERAGRTGRQRRSGRSGR